MYTKLDIITTLEIFNKPVIRKKFKEVMEENREEFLKRFNLFKNYIIDNWGDNYNFDAVEENFKEKFEKYILEKAIENMLCCKNGESFNIIKNILKLLNNDEYEKAIHGKPIVEAFQDLFTNFERKCVFESEFMNK